jgi:hypothetical protein
VSHFPQTGSGVMYFALRAEKPVSTVALSVSGDSDSPHFSHVAFWLYRFLDAGVGLARNATYLTPYSRLVPARIAHLGRAEDTTARLGALAPGRALAPALHRSTRPPGHRRQRPRPGLGHSARPELAEGATRLGDVAQPRGRERRPATTRRGERQAVTRPASRPLWPMKRDRAWRTDGVDSPGWRR